MDKKSDHINLNQIGKSYPFNTPDGYFDYFSERMMARVEIGNKQTSSSFFVRYLKPSLGLAASFLIIISLLYVPVKYFSPGKMETEQTTSLFEDTEYFISYPLSDHNIFETLETTAPDDAFDNNQLETELLASLNEYELIDLTN